MDTFLNMLCLSSIACYSLDSLSSPNCFDVSSRDEESKRNNLVLLRFLIIARLDAISVKHCTKTILLIDENSCCIVWGYLQGFHLHVTVPIPINCLYWQGLQYFIWVRAFCTFSVCLCRCFTESMWKWRSFTGQMKSNNI